MSTFLRNAAAAVNGAAPGRAEGTAQPMAVDFPLERISSDPTAQIRVMPSDKIEEYAQQMQDPDLLAEFPPVHLFEDPDSGVVRISRGFTRIAAARLAGLETFRAVVFGGGGREALVHALGSNARHGDPRTSADLLYELDIVLKDPELALWSDREIARRVHCTHKTVGDRRRFWIEQGEIKDDGTRRRTDRHGNVSTINVAAISAANTARTGARTLDEKQTYSTIQRGLGQQDPGVMARYEWLRTHDAPADYAFVTPAGWTLDEAVFANMWQRAHDELYAHLPKAKGQAAPQPANLPAAQPARPTPAPARASGSVAWNGRGHNALTNLAVYLGGVLDELAQARGYLHGSFDHMGYKRETETLLSRVNEVLDAMQADGDEQEGSDPYGDADD